MQDKPPIKRLLRSEDERVLAGICGGLSEHFNTDPVLFRVGFGIAALFGVGIVAYLALYIFVPREGSGGVPEYADDGARLAAGVLAGLVVLSMSGGFLPFGRSDIGPFWGIVWVLVAIAGLGAIAYGAVLLWRRTQARGGEKLPQEHSEWSAFRVLAMIALIIAMLVLALILGGLAAWIGATAGSGLVIATAVVTGVLLIAGIASRRLRWVLVPAIAIAVPLAIVEISGIEIEGGYGDRHVTPPSTAAIPEQGYEMAAGDLLVNLRRIDWARGDKTVDLDVSMGIGRVSILVPPDVCVSADTHAKVGAVSIRGDSEAGIDVTEGVETVPEAGPTLNLDGDVEVGLIQVVIRPPHDNWTEESEDWRHEDEPPQPRECFAPR